ncbi:hypothetical protein [Streptomyces sp. NPDC017230]|uniref:hypothetical protein n=1 Tax=unclassified Streptomyces TaxID=2593676 RepID=UPI0037B41DB3
MGLFSRATANELRDEAKQVEANIASATRTQKAFGAKGTHGEDNVIAGYQHQLNQINEELKRH